MIIFSWRSAHRFRRVLGPYGVDPLGQHTFRHQLDKISPNALPAPSTEFVARAMWVDPVAKQDLRPVDVAHPGQDGLIHQECGDRPSGTRNSQPGKIRIRVWPERIRTEFPQPQSHFGRSPHRTQLRPPQVGSSLRRCNTHAYLTTRRPRWTKLETANETQVDMQQPITVELAKQVLAVRRRFDQSRLIKLRSRLGEAALRAGDRDNSAAEGFRQIKGKPVQRMAFRHGPSLS
jgi:hypothetical protein